MRSRTDQNSSSRATLVRWPAKEKLRLTRPLRRVLLFNDRTRSSPFGAALWYWTHAFLHLDPLLALDGNVFHIGEITDWLKSGGIT